MQTEPLTLTPHMGDHARDIYWATRGRVVNAWPKMTLARCAALFAFTVAVGSAAVALI